MPVMHLLIKGKVQGVFYRASAKEAADNLGITGWVRNTPEGDVEIMAAGDEHSLQRFLNWCRKGPKLARVTRVEILPAAPLEAGDFTIKK